MRIELMKYALQIEFLGSDVGDICCQLFVRKGEKEIAKTPPQLMDREICLQKLADIAQSFEIPEHEHIGLAIQLESAFRQRLEQTPKIVVPTPLERAIVDVTLNVEVICTQYLDGMNRQ